MKINTRLKLAALLPVLMAFVIGLAFLFSYETMEEAREKSQVAHRIQVGTNDLNNSVRSYMLFHEERPRLQFLKEYDSITKLISTTRFGNSEQQRLLNGLRYNSESMRDTFLKLVSNYERHGSVKDTALLREAEERLAGQILIRSRDVLSDSLRLENLISDELATSQRRLAALIFILIVTTTVPITVASIRIKRNIVTSLAILGKGTEIIGAGDLDHRIGLPPGDELGELARSFDLMTEQLRVTTVSRDALSKEVEERKRAEESLREQREWLRVTLSSIGDAVITSDTKGRITFLNPVAVTLTGWQVEETVGQPIQSVFRIINEKTQVPAEDLVARVLSEKRVVALANDTALVTKDGRKVPIEDSAAPILDAAGNLIGVVLVFHDVTERRRAQAALREAHERAVWLARFPDENPNPVLRASADGIVLYCNPATSKFSGWTCEVGQPIQNKLLPLVHQAMAEGREVQKDIQLHGKFYIVWAVPFHEERYANVYGRDITERKRAEEALRDAHEQAEADLGGMTRLQKLGNLFLHEGNLEPVLAEIVDAAIAISGADFGNIQLLDPDSSDLKIAAHRGFPEWWLDFWNSVGKGQGACGTALERGERVIIEDIEKSPIFIGTPALEIQLKAGVRAVQSTPLVSRSGRPLGMFSTHYKKPRGPDDRVLGLLDLLARQTADIIERAQAEELLRENERRLNRAQEIAHLGSWELDVVNNRLTWSDEVYRIFGLQPQEFGATYEAFLEAVHPGDRDTVDAAYSASLREGIDTYEIEHRVVRKSTGEIRTVLERCEHIRDASGQIIRSIGMVHDITERKRAEKALRERTLELQQLSETLEQQVQERTEELEVANEELRTEIDECQRVETELIKSQGDLRRLSIDLVNAQEKERKLVAGEIHDSIGSSLSAIKFKVVTALTEVGDRSPETAAALQSLIPIVQGAIDEARRIQTNLRPSMLDDLGVLVTIRWFCRQFESTYSKIRVRQSIEIEERDVPDFLKTVIFRVLQEGLNNIAKHSKANVVLLFLQKTKQAIYLVIRDNGQGFDLSKAQSPSGTTQGLGLKSMRERIELSGGSFAIESAEAKGTAIRASWPLAKKE